MEGNHDRTGDAFGVWERRLQVELANLTDESKALTYTLKTKLLETSTVKDHRHQNSELSYWQDMVAKLTEEKRQLVRVNIDLKSDVPHLKHQLRRQTERSDKFELLFKEAVMDKKRYEQKSDNVKTPIRDQQHINPRTPEPRIGMIFFLNTLYIMFIYNDFYLFSQAGQAADKMVVSRQFEEIRLLEVEVQNNLIYLKVNKLNFVFTGIDHFTGCVTRCHRQCVHYNMYTSCNYENDKTIKIYK